MPPRPLKLNPDPNSIEIPTLNVSESDAKHEADRGVTVSAAESKRVHAKARRDASK